MNVRHIPRLPDIPDRALGGFFGSLAIGFFGGYGTAFLGTELYAYKSEPLARQIFGSNSNDRFDKKLFTLTSCIVNGCVLFSVGLQQRKGLYIGAGLGMIILAVNNITADCFNNAEGCSYFQPAASVGPNW